MSVTREEIARHRPDVLLPPDPEFAADYATAVARGRSIAADSSVAFVAICRNAMPWLPETLLLVEETGRMFRSWIAYVHENDSTDGTQEVLRAWQDGDRRHASINEFGRPHLCGEKTATRTAALAEYRTACQAFVAGGPRVDFVVVFDTDAWGGWSVDGVATSIAALESRPDAIAMASYSWCELELADGRAVPAHYDAWACRWNWWGERDHRWFHHWHPPVGSPPVPMNSAFGQLAVYARAPYLRGRYAGGDCEHVTFHRSVAGRVYLNPGSRCVSFWVPSDDGRQHGDG
jgi:hypothetical protein